MSWRVVEITRKNGDKKYRVESWYEVLGHAVGGQEFTEKCQAIDWCDKLIGMEVKSEKVIYPEPKYTYTEVKHNPHPPKKWYQW